MNNKWGTTTLGGISELITKGTTPTSVGFKFTDSGINFIKVESLTQNGQFIEQKLAHISGECNDALKRSQLKSGDILFSIAGALGRTAMVTPEVLPANTNQALAIIRLKPDIKVLSRFVLIALSSGMLLEQVERQRGGVAQQNLSLTQLKSFQIPLPPLPEQQRIVSILDEVFKGIGKAVANIERNLENSRELFESYLRILFSEQQKGWFETTVGKQATLQRGFDITKKNQNPGEIPVVSSGGIKSYHDISKVDGPGVVIGRKGSLGTVHYVEKNYWPHDTTLWVKDFHENDPRLVYYFFKQLDVKSLDTGTANPALNRNHVHPIKILWPGTSEQQKVVTTLDKVSDKTKHLEEVYQQKLTFLEELKQSILQKAFTGELAANNVDKIMEPA